MKVKAYLLVSGDGEDRFQHPRPITFAVPAKGIIVTLPAGDEATPQVGRWVTPGEVIEAFDNHPFIEIEETVFSPFIEFLRVSEMAKEEVKLLRMEAERLFPAVDRYYAQDMERFAEKTGKALDAFIAEKPWEAGK